MDLEVLYEKLLRYCYMRTHDRYLAEDIVQDTFVRFYSNHSYKETGKQLAYLYTIARNLCIDSYRRPKTVDLESVGEAVEFEPGAKTETDDLLDKMCVEQAMECLDEEGREILMLRFNQELSTSDIGEILGISRFAVYRKIQKYLKEMKLELYYGSILIFYHDEE